MHQPACERSGANRRRRSVDAAAYVLSDDLALHGPKFGCGLGQCGACTVIVNGRAIRSCVTPVEAVAGAEITTLEGLGTPEQAASDSAGLHRRAGRAVRLLPERRHPDRQGAARSNPEADRRRRSSRRCRACCAGALRTQRMIARDQALREREDGMNGLPESPTPESPRNAGVSRRDPAKAPARSSSPSRSTVRCRSARPWRRWSGSPPKELDAWIAIGADGIVTAYTGKCELGQGLFTAQTQLIAEELCVPIGRVTPRSSATPVSRPIRARPPARSRIRRTSITRTWRSPAATAREALLQLAAEHLGVPVDQLTARDGVDRAEATRASDLRRADRRQEVQPRRSMPTPQRKRRRASGPCSASRSRASTCRRW